MNAISILKVVRFTACVCGSLVLLVYIALIALLPAMYWVMDGGLTLSLWLALAAIVLFGGWWVIWRDAPKFGWVWLGVFIAIHAMLFLSPSVRGSYEQDTCIDIGGRWHNGECVTN
jgi:hypothetical protein